MEKTCLPDKTVEQITTSPVVDKKFQEKLVGEVKQTCLPTCISNIIISYLLDTRILGFHPDQCKYGFHLSEEIQCRFCPRQFCESCSRIGDYCCDICT